MTKGAACFIVGVASFACGASSSDRVAQPSPVASISAPSPVRHVTTETKTVVLVIPNIRFAIGSVEITPDELVRIEQGASTWKSHPEFLSIDVVGNADPTEPNGVELSKTRASKVMHELVRLGVEPARLTAVAYGSLCDPHARVGFTIVTTKDGPTHAPRGCDAASAAGLH